MSTRSLLGSCRLLSAGAAVTILAACGGESPTMPPPPAPTPRVWLASYQVLPDPVIKSQPFTVFVLGGAENTVVDSVVISWGEGVVVGFNSFSGRRRVTGASGNVTIVAPANLFTLGIVVYGPLGESPMRVWVKIPR